MKVKLDDVAIESRKTISGSKHGLPIVGLEHLTPNELTLSSWDVDTDNTFTKLFHKGQILFGRRRAYLKKAAVAPFDGICSGDITVIEAISDKILPELLPFIIQNDNFFDFAVGKSAGSLSPRAKWEHLRLFEFNLPSFPEQRKLTDLLWAANATREAYKKLLNLTDQIVKSRFVEMFGDPVTNPMGWEVLMLKDIATEKLSYGSGASSTNYDNEIRYVRITDITDNGELNNDIVSPSEYDEKYLLRDGDILFARSGATVGKTFKYSEKWGICIYAGYLIRLIPDTNMVLPDYIFAYTKTDYYQEFVKLNQRTVAQPNINAQQYGDLGICVPPLSLQNRFAEFVKQADKSSFEIRRTIDELEATYKAILRENLG